MNDHADDGRRTVYAEVCVRSADGIDTMARTIGCSRAAMIDAIGHALSSPELRDLLAEHPAWPVVEAKARQIDSDRRTRSR